MNELVRKCIRIITAVVMPSVVFAANGDLSADATVGGQVRGKVTWTRTESPYVAIQSVEVPAGSILTIEPGVEVRFSGHSFVVRGTLIAKGTAEAPIRFTSQNLDSPAPQDWGLLTFEGQSSAASYDESWNYVAGSIMEHVIVEYGHGLFFNGGGPLVSHSTIRHNRKKRGGGIYAHGCKVVVSNSQVSYNVAEEEGGGIRSAYCEPVLIRNTITLNSARYDGGGISIDHSAARIEENAISHNFASHAGGVSTGETQVGQTSVTGKSHSKPQILRNRIINNTACYSGGGIVVLGTPVIVGNTIAGNRILYTQYAQQPSNDARIERKSGAGAGVKVTGTYGGPLTIQGNVIAGNRGAFWGGGMCFDRAAGTVQKNRIVANHAKLHGGAVSILVRSSVQSFVGGDHGAAWRFSDNDIRGNSDGVFELAMARFGGEQAVLVSHCNLSDNVGKTFVNHTKNKVLAADNWWGTTDVKLIGGLIEDFYDNGQYGPIRFEPGEAAHDIAGLPEVSSEEVAFVASYPEEVRAGQGFNRIPGTPPSVTIIWKVGNVEKPAGYLVYFSRVEPRFDEMNLASDLRIPAKCLEGESPVDVGNVHRTVLSGFEIGTTYEFSVAAYDHHGHESAMSDSYAVKVER
jgi:hypothetical protein